MIKKNLDTITSFIIMITGIIILMVPSFKIYSSKIIFTIFLCVYAIINIINFLLNIKKNEYVFKTISSILVLVLLYLLNGESDSNIALALFVWLIFISLIKLKDCNNVSNKKSFLKEMITLVLSIIIGLITVLNLYTYKGFQLVILGYFILSYGLVELIKTFDIKK